MNADRDKHYAGKPQPYQRHEVIIYLMLKQ